MQFDQTNILPDKTVDFAQRELNPNAARAGKREQSIIHMPVSNQSMNPPKALKLLLAPMIWHVDKINMNC
jgi:hypothetical protein